MVVTWDEAFEVLNMVHLGFSCFKALLYPKCIPSMRKPQFQPNNDLQSKCILRSEKCLLSLANVFVISLKGSIFGIEKKPSFGGNLLNSPLSTRRTVDSCSLISLQFAACF